MPSFPRSALRAPLVALLAVTALGASTATAQAGITVTIQPPGSADPVSISTDDVAEKDRDMNTTYTVARSGGSPQKVKVTDGISVKKLLDLTDTNFDYATIELRRPNGDPLRLSKGDVDDETPPGFYTDEQGVTRFIGVTGANRQVAARDYFEVSGNVNMLQARQSKFRVTISPKKKKVALGATVSFRATVEGLDDLSGIVYSWTVDGKRRSGAGHNFVYDFPSKDKYFKVSVTAEFAGGRNHTDVATIEVGDPDEAEQEDDEESSDPSPPAPGTTPYEGGSPAPYVPTPAPTPTPTPTPAPEPAEPPDIATSGTTVEGNLLADASDPPPSNILESAAQAAREGKKDGASNDADAGVSEAALGIAGLLALLGLGAGIENRQGRRLPRPRLRLPRRAS